MATTKADFDLSIKRHYREEGGQNSPYGKVMYRVLSNRGNGHGWYWNKKSEDHYLSATGGSYECLGGNIPKERSKGSDPLYCAKLIHCKNGDIVLDADNGDIILKGDNVLIEANGIKNTGDGNCLIDCNNELRLDAPQVKCESTDLRLCASKDLTLVGKVYAELIGGTAAVTQAADFGASTIIGKITAIAKSFGFM